MRRGELRQSLEMRGNVFYPAKFHQPGWRENDTQTWNSEEISCVSLSGAENNFEGTLKDP